MRNSKTAASESLGSVLFDTLAYVDKLSGVVTSFYDEYACSVSPEKPPFLARKKAFGQYSEKTSEYLEIMYRALVRFKDPLVRGFFRHELDAKNFLVWLRSREAGVPWEGRVLHAGDWRPIVMGQGADMGFVPERDEIVRLFQNGEWAALAPTLFSAWRKRLAILASFRSDIVVEMILVYLKEEESRWKIKAS